MPRKSPTHKAPDIPQPANASWSFGDRDRIEFDGALLRIHTRGNSEEISPELVKLVAGEAGLTLDGGTTMVWKRLHILTESGRRTLRLGPETGPVAYEHLAKVCTTALCISAKGAVQLGSPEADPSGWLSDAVRLVKIEFHRQAFASLVGAVVAGAVTIVVGIIAYLVIFKAQAERFPRGLLIVPPISGIITLFLLEMALRRLLRGVRVTRVLRKAMGGKVINPRVLDNGLPRTPTK